jgi:ABC-2 type transport system ATP-binding protein
MRSGATPSDTSQATRAQRVVVFPVPAPAKISRGPLGCVAATRCSGLSSTSQAGCPACSEADAEPNIRSASYGRARTDLPVGGGGARLNYPFVLPSTKALHIEDLVKRYPTGVVALHGVSLDIEGGEIFGLLGPNGAGKSTLIHCTTGLAQPTSGSIRVFGHDAIRDYGDARQAVGLAPQELNLDWFLTVEETLDYHAGYFGMPKRERRERAKELIEIFSLQDKRNERTRTLSGGMKRRLILARALMHKPRLLILDEPTAGVDIELRLELWHYVQRINDEGTTILLTTHYLEEADQLCDRIAFINEGQIIAKGSSAELAANYGVANLEDAYLALVGRKELSRSHAPVEELAS